MTASEYVVDASALVAALTRKDGVGTAVRKLLADSRVHAPYLIDAEVGQALRALERRGEVTADEASTGLRALRGLVDERYDQVVLLERTWSLRHTITFYDGLYVVLASALDMSLLTGDARLSNAPGLDCKVELLR